MKAGRLLRMAKRLYCRFYDDDLPALGAQLTYYLVLSFFPFLIFLLTLIGYTPLSSDILLEDLARLLPAGAYEPVADIFARTAGVKSGTLLSFSMLAALWTASTGVLALIKGINKAYDSKETRPFWKTRGISILFTLALTLVILLTLAALVFGEVIWKHMILKLGFTHVLKTSWDIVRFTVVLAVLMAVFMFLYRCLPNRRLSAGEVFPGSLFAAAGWILISLAFSYYINQFANFSILYGSIGGIIALLLWLYWSSMIILVGGEVNATLAFDRKTPEEC